MKRRRPIPETELPITTSITDGTEIIMHHSHTYSSFGLCFVFVPIGYGTYIVKVNTKKFMISLYVVNTLLRKLYMYICHYPISET